MPNQGKYFDIIKEKDEVFGEIQFLDSTKQITNTLNVESQNPFHNTPKFSVSNASAVDERESLKQKLRALGVEDLDFLINDEGIHSYYTVRISTILNSTQHVAVAYNKNYSGRRHGEFLATESQVLIFDHTGTEINRFPPFNHEIDRIVLTENSKYLGLVYGTPKDCGYDADIHTSSVEIYNAQTLEKFTELKDIHCPPSTSVKGNSFVFRCLCDGYNFYVFRSSDQKFFHKRHSMEEYYHPTQGTHQDGVWFYENGVKTSFKNYDDYYELLIE